MAKPALDEYRRKRDFAATPEPAPADEPDRQGPLVFVVQRHTATRLHYDIRLEMEGVLRSWAVPRGPSTDTSERRLAVRTEDHPIAYGHFEGVIPKGEYGAGQVIVWDIGTYSPDEGGRLLFDDREAAGAEMLRQLAAGKLSVTFRGRRLKGSWSFVHMSGGEEDAWLLLKHPDAAADTGRDITGDISSVLSGLTNDDLAAGRMPRAGVPLPAYSPSLAPGANLAPLPAPVSPMLAAQGDGPFDDPAWIFEPKFDGIRAIAHLDHGQVELRSRRKLPLTDQYPALVAALRAQPANTAVFDGEIVAFDEAGRPSFERLQQRMNLAGAHEIREADARIPVAYLVFDVLYLDGYDLSRVPLRDRKELLARVVLPSGNVAPVEYVTGDGVEAYRAAIDLGFEGLVAKRLDSAYQKGRRSPAWRKIKSRTTGDFVVGGYSRGEGSRAASFGGLLLGDYDPEGNLTYCGRVGSGFTDAALRDVLARLEPLRVEGSPFAGDVPDAQRVTFVRPELVVEVEYAERTSAGLLRAPVFLRVRQDKAPDDLRVVAPASPADTGERSTASERDAVLAQLDTPAAETVIEVGGHQLKLTNLDKELWPPYRDQRPVTKRDLLRYVTRLAPHLLRHLRDRPLTMTRYPNGITGAHFYQRHSEAAIPEFVETVPIFSRQGKGDRPFILCNNLPTLLWLAQIADLEFHAAFGRVDPAPDALDKPTVFTGSVKTVERSVLHYPDFIVFDMDPYIYRGNEATGEEPQLNRAAFARTCETARWLKEVLDAARLSSYVKTSGATGLHVYVPVLRQFDYSVTRSVAETIFAQVLDRHPDRVTMEWLTGKRTGKVFLDANMNARTKNLASVYSPRAKPGAPVSMPLRWDELDDVYPTDFTVLTAPDLVEARGDLWAGILDDKQDLAALLGIAPDD
ncbi:MAG: DNA ligase D [Dehalococcoidia bacterium]